MQNRVEDLLQHKSSQLLAIQVAVAAVLLLVGAVVVILQHGRITRLEERVSALQKRADLLDQSILATPPVALGGTMPPDSELPDARADLIRRIGTLASKVDVRFSLRDTGEAVAVLADMAAMDLSATQMPSEVANAVMALYVATEQPRRALDWGRLAAAAGADAGRVAILQAAASMQMGKPQEALAAIEAAGAAELEAAPLLLRAQIESALGMQSEAEATLVRASRFDAAAADAAAGLVPVWLDRGDVERAAELLDRAEMVAPRRYDLAKWRARVLLAQRSFDRCIEVASMLVLVDTTDTDMLATLGEAQLGASRAAEAVATFTSLVRQRPDDARAHLSLGVALFAQLRPVDAAERFAVAADLAPESPDGWYHLGVARSNAGQCGVAIEALDRVIAIDPTHAHAHFARAVCLARQDDDAEAQQALQRALSLDAALVDQAAQVRAFERILASGEVVRNSGGS